MVNFAKSIRIFRLFWNSFMNAEFLRNFQIIIYYLLCLHLLFRNNKILQPGIFLDASPLLLVYIATSSSSVRTSWSGNLPCYVWKVKCFKSLSNQISSFKCFRRDLNSFSKQTSTFKCFRRYLNSFSKQNSSLFRSTALSCFSTSYPWFVFVNV